MEYDRIYEPEDLRIGDIIRIDNDQYAIVCNYVDPGDTRCDFISIDEDGVYEDDCRLSDIERMYTRYTTKNNSSSNSLESRVADKLDDLRYNDKKYAEEEDWYEDRYNDSEALWRADGEDESFAFELSDELFGDRDYEILNGEDIDELRVGDIIYDEEDATGEVYGVVTYVGSKEVEYVGLNSSDEIDWSNSVRINKIGSFISRY